MAGVVHHLPAIAAITAPSVSSYFRLRPNRWAPTWANLGYGDRGASVRICPGPVSSAEEVARQFNVEFRVADATASPYLALGALIHAGVDGIRNETRLPTVTKDFWAISEADRTAAGIARLPTSLCEALDNLAACQEARDWFGEDLFNAYLQFKRSEIQALEGLDATEVCRRYSAVY